MARSECRPDAAHSGGTGAPLPDFVDRNIRTSCVKTDSRCWPPRCYRKYANFRNEAGLGIPYSLVYISVQNCHYFCFCSRKFCIIPFTLILLFLVAATAGAAPAATALQPNQPANPARA